MLEGSDAIARLSVAVQAGDVGWGVREVRARILDASSLPIWSSSRSIAPYAFEPIELHASGRYLLQAVAYDHAGFSRQAEAEFEVRPGAAGSCSFSPSAWGPRPLVLAGVLLAGNLYRRRKRR